MFFQKDDACWVVPYQQGVVFFSGRGTPLRPKDALALALLVRKRGQIVSNDELIAELWPDGAVEDPLALIKHIMSRLRKILPKNLVWIEHVMEPKGRSGGQRQVGYKLMGSITFRETKE